MESATETAVSNAVNGNEINQEHSHNVAEALATEIMAEGGLEALAEAINASVPTNDHHMRLKNDILSYCHDALQLQATIKADEDSIAATYTRINGNTAKIAKVSAWLGKATALLASYEEMNPSTEVELISGTGIAEPMLVKPPAKVQKAAEETKPRMKVNLSVTYDGKQILRPLKQLMQPKKIYSDIQLLELMHTIPSAKNVQIAQVRSAVYAGAASGKLTKHTDTTPMCYSLPV